MQIAGVWVGWGLGDDNPKVADMKGFLRRKFPSYASGLDDSTLYDETTAAVVAAKLPSPATCSCTSAEAPWSARWTSVAPAPTSASAPSRVASSG